MKSFLFKKSAFGDLRFLKSKLAVFAVFVFTFIACNDQDLVMEQDRPSAAYSQQSAQASPGLIELPGLTVRVVEELLANVGTDLVGILSPILDLIDIPGDAASIFIRTYKVSTPFPNPNGSGEMIDVSGILLVPAYLPDSLRFIISSVPTYTENSSAPSNIFSGEVPLLYDDFLNYQYFFAINALQGCAILIPDYPGFGDSYGKCYHPYLGKEALTQSTIALAQAAREGLTESSIPLKRESIVTGYSQGAFVATSIGRELDLHGEEYNLPINLLVSGGTPANLNILKDIARKAPILGEIVPQPLLLSFIYPYGILGYKENGYPELDLSAALKEPFDRDCYEYFNGQHSVLEVTAHYPKNNLELFTKELRDNDEEVPTIARINEILTENSIEPWVNKAPVTFVHGLIDEVVYYDNIKDFVDRMEAIGGTPDLQINPLTEHVTTLVDYYIRIAAYIAAYK